MTVPPEDSDDSRPTGPSPHDAPGADGNAGSDETDTTAGQSTTTDSASTSDNLDKVRQINRKKRTTRRDVDSDDDVTNTATHSTPPVAGLDAFRGLRGIAPFLWLVCVYAESQHSRRKSPQSKLDQFTSEHPGRVRIAFYLDLCLQAVLVLFLLIVVARGVGLVDLIERIDALIH